MCLDVGLRISRLVIVFVACGSGWRLVLGLFVCDLFWLVLVVLRSCLGDLFVKMGLRWDFVVLRRSCLCLFVLV